MHNHEQLSCDRRTRQTTHRAVSGKVIVHVDNAVGGTYMRRVGCDGSNAIWSTYDLN